MSCVNLVSPDLAPWVSHLAYDWETPEIRSYAEALARDRQVVRYDRRGTGLSDRVAEPTGYDLAVQVGVCWPCWMPARWSGPH